MKGVHEEGWRDEVGRKASLKWFRLAKEIFGRKGL